MGEEGLRRNSSKKPKSKRKIKIQFKRHSRKKPTLTPQEKLRARFWPRGNRQPTAMEIFHLLLALTGIIMSIVMMGEGATDDSQISTKILVFISGGTVLVSGPVVVYNRTKLTLMDTFRQVLNTLRLEANKLTGQNDKLQKSIDNLETEVDRLKEIEHGLSDIATKQGLQQQELIELIQENKRINRELKRALQSAALQRILGIMMDCDVNQDFVLEGAEIDRLIIGLQQVEEVEVDAESFRKLIVDNGGSLAVVFEIMKEWFTDEEDLDAKLEAEESELHEMAKSLQVVAPDRFMMSKMRRESME